MSQKRITTKEEFEAEYGDFDSSEEPVLLPERLDGTLAREMSERRRLSKLDTMIEAERSVVDPTPEQEEAVRRDVEQKLEPKQVLVVRTDLQMRKGKMVSQGAHASGKVFFDTIPREALEVAFPEGFERVRLTIEVDRSMFMWLAGIFTKICCRVDSEAELLEIYEKAKAAGLPCSLIEDRGLTEFGGVPTKTCCSVGPAPPR